MLNFIGQANKRYNFAERFCSSYSGKRGLISRIQSFEEDTGKELTFAKFISHYHMDAREIYGKFSFARLMDVSFAELPAVQLRMMRTFYITVWQKYMADFDNKEVLQNRMDLANSHVMLVKMWYVDNCDGEVMKEVAKILS